MMRFYTSNVLIKMKIAGVIFFPFFIIFNLLKALSARLKSTSLKKEHNSPQKSSLVKLESKESIVEIKQLRTKIANLENELNSKDLEMKCLQQARKNNFRK